MIEADCLFIKNPAVVTNFSRYHVVASNDKLNLSYKTTVTRCFDFGGSIFGFDFNSLDCLSNNRIPSGKIIGNFSVYFTIVILCNFFISKLVNSHLNFFIYDV
jgi:hypothetical protein